MAPQNTGIDVTCHFDCPGDNEAIQDLDMYMLAVYSYPDHFAGKPHLTFQRHLRNVIHAESRRAAGNLQS
ncbi:MAG TPA: hypothetical protein VJX16_11165 [Terriglobales bacterium]|nr:hypothetical protein [Terriglobales bacterium]